MRLGGTGQPAAASALVNWRQGEQKSERNEEPEKKKDMKRIMTDDNPPPVYPSRLFEYVVEVGGMECAGLTCPCSSP